MTLAAPADLHPRLVLQQIQQQVFRGVPMTVSISCTASNLTFAAGSVNLDYPGVDPIQMRLAHRKISEHRGEKMNPSAQNGSERKQLTPTIRNRIVTYHA